MNWHLKFSNWLWRTATSQSSQCAIVACRQLAAWIRQQSPVAAHSRRFPDRSVHVVTVSSQQILGHPRLLTPSTSPVDTLLSMVLCVCLITHPKYFNFLDITWCSSCFSVSVAVLIDLFLRNFVNLIIIDVLIMASLVFTSLLNSASLVTIIVN